MSLVAGVVAVNAAFAAVGYACLARSLAGAPWRSRASWAGVALLIGAGVVGTGVFFATIAGARASLLTAAVVAAVAAALGLLLRFELVSPAARVSPPTAAAFGVVAAVCALGIVGGFRSAPWLDDAWGIWLPKGLALWHHGLDERLFVPNGEYVAFGVPDYPLWWSVVTSLDAQAVGGLDVRVMCAQLALLATAFAGSVARLLWGHVRTEVLAASLLLLMLAPELWRHVQGGVADLPLAIYVALGVLSGALWLRTRAGFHLALAGFCGAVALQIKTEALPEVVTLAVVGGLAARRLALAALALLAALPWLAWRWVHDVPGRAGDLDLSRLQRIPQAVTAVAEHAFDPTEWLVLLPLVLALALLARRPRALAPLAALFLVIVAAYWVDRDEIDYVLATSVYRVIDPLVLTAGVLVPLLADAFLEQREALREDRALVRQP